jgi:hypothetical protein
MGYWEQSQLAIDADFAARVIACSSTEGFDDPEGWAWRHRYDLAASPGFADAYSSAIAGDVANPGRDPAVISDAQILSAVQAIGPDAGAELEGDAAP